MADNDDKTVKQLLDAGTRADLERWFGLPSFEQLADEGKTVEPPEDPEFIAVRKRRAEAIAAIDPALVEAHRRRTDIAPDLFKISPTMNLVVDPSITRLDLPRLERQNAHLEPRQVEIPPSLEDDLRNCTPQALLRDLHRPELTFDKTFEIVDVVAEQRVDIRKVIAEVMTTRHRIELGPSPLQEARALILELREIRHSPWTEIKMPDRSWS
jgi:hypothetical protein